MTTRNKTAARIGWLALCVLFSFCRAGAQADFWNTKDAYLGQTPPADEPQVFAANLLKDSGIVLGRVSFSPDGKAFYYSYAAHWFDDRGAGTKEIKFDGSKWQRPVVIAEQLTNPALSPDYTKIFLGGAGSRVWALEKAATGWSEPKLWLEMPYGLYNFQAAASGTYYAGSNGNGGSKADYSTYDFCKMTISGKDTVIQSLGSTLNTPGFDGDFFIAPDESYIVVSAKETPTYECELWMSFRKSDGSWTVPQSLGDKINKGSAHRFGQYVSPDGKYLFYTKGTSEKDCAVYWVRFDTLLQGLKPKGLR